MRIAVNTRFLQRGRLEGIGWFTHEVLRRLVARRPQDEFLLLFDRPFDPAFVPPGAQAQVLMPPARHALLWWWWFERSVPRTLRRFGADVFLSPDGFASLSTSVPTVMVTHDIAHVHFPQQVPLHGRLFYRRYVPRYLQQAAQVVTVSEFSKADILQHYPSVPSSKIHVACNGCREAFAPLSEAQKAEVRNTYTQGQPYFFYLGSVNPRKNVHRLIAAFDAFKASTQAPVKLLIGGRLGWQTGAVHEALTQARYRDDIHQLGYVSDDALPLLLGAALALTYVSVFEGFGVPLLEAMHSEVPILTANVSSMPEIAGPAALLVDPFSAEAIAEGLGTLWAQPDLRERLVAAGRTQRQHFDWDKAVEVVEQAILAAARQ